MRHNKNIKVIDINIVLSIIALSVSGINTAIKRQKISNLIKKAESNYILSKETYFRARSIEISWIGSNKLKIKREKTYLADSIRYSNYFENRQNRL